MEMEMEMEIEMEREREDGVKQTRQIVHGTKNQNVKSPDEILQDINPLLVERERFANFALGRLLGQFFHHRSKVNCICVFKIQQSVCLGVMQH
jgi:hypothetical protein